MRRSLTTALTVPLLATLFVLGIGMFVLLDSTIEQRLTRDFDEAILTRMRALMAITRFELEDPEEGHDTPWVEFDFDAENSREFESGPNAEYFQLRIEGEVLGQSRSLQGRHRIDDAIAAPADDLIDRPAFLDISLPDGRAGRIGRLHFLPQFDEDWHPEGARRAQVFAERHPGLQRPTVMIELAISRATLDATLSDVRLVLWLGLAATLLATAVLVPLLTRAGLKPVRELRDQLGVVGAQQLAKRLDPARLPRELVPIAEGVNALLERLQHAFDKERLFSRNVAHELRTPIAELRTLGEVYAAFPGDPEAAAQRFAEVARIGQRMDRLVNNLLLMARQEQGAVPVCREPIDLAVELRAALQRISAEDSASIRLIAPQHCWASADRSHLDSILNNLVDNLLEHRHGEGECRIELRGSDRSVELSVQNPASGLEAADIDHLFDRFWRKDDARTPGRHVGLGLSLVKSLCEVLGWQLQLSLNDGHFKVHISGIQSCTEPSA